MASLQMQSSAFGPPSSGKVTKPRSRSAVKPILKKLHSHHSDRESLDLDRGWDDQPSPRLASLDYGYAPYDNDLGVGLGVGGASTTRTARDVSFSFGPTDISSVGGGVASCGGAMAAAAGRAKYAHARSTSGTSHASIATTNSAGRNGGSFVHPFQQTPHASTLPLSFSARASLDNPNGLAPRDYSPTITEDGDDVDVFASSSARPPVAQAACLPQHRRSSLASQRTTSASDGTLTLRAAGNRSNSGSVQRFVSSSVNHSRSELELSASTSVVDLGLSTTAPLTTSRTTLSSAQVTTTNATTTTATSSLSSSVNPTPTVRSSLDMGFRLRSRSEVDTATRQEQVREARRKFEAKERAKEEKYAREQVRKRERADSKEAQKQEREQTRLRKGSRASLDSIPHLGSHGGLHLRRGASSKTSRIDDGEDNGPLSEKAPQSRADNVQFKSPKRTKTAKHKTAGVWTAFMLWLRTRLIKLGRR